MQPLPRLRDDAARPIRRRQTDPALDRGSFDHCLGYAVARVHIADHSRGLSRKLTRYGDEAFARFLREAFLESSRALARILRPAGGRYRLHGERLQPVPRDRSRTDRRDSSGASRWRAGCRSLFRPFRCTSRSRIHRASSCGTCSRWTPRRCCARCRSMPSCWSAAATRRFPRRSWARSARIFRRSWHRSDRCWPATTKASGWARARIAGGCGHRGVPARSTTPGSSARVDD